MNQNESKQSILAHLAALRKVLVISAAAICIAFLVIFYTCIDPVSYTHLTLPTKSLV